jgi:hypothetical protein
MLLTFTVTGENFDRILKKAQNQAEAFFENYPHRWKIEVGEIVVSKTTNRGALVEAYEYEAEITVTHYEPPKDPPHGKNVEFISGLGRMQ